jgi:NADH/NAD ratio-sensing transcriptional regulator Rex
MRFEDLMDKPIEEMNDEDLEKIASQMELKQLKTLEKNIKKVGKKKKSQTKKLEKAQNAVDSLIAEGLSS